MKKVLGILDIIIPLILLIVLLFAKLSDNTVYLITLTLFVGWVIPYFMNIISGIIILKETHQKLGIISNLLSAILALILLIFAIRIYDKKMLILIIEYSILTILSIINFIYLIIFRIKHPSEEMIETKDIKEKKRKNNGAIV